MGELVNEIKSGNGYSLAAIDMLGEGYGFRKVREALGVTAYGINVVVIPAGFPGRKHSHERQQETYFVHQGTIEFSFGQDGEESFVLGPGGVVHVEPHTIRLLRNVGDSDAIYLCVGGDGGYVERDGVTVD